MALSVVGPEVSWPTVPCTFCVGVGPAVSVAGVGPAVVPVDRPVSVPAPMP